MAPFEKKFQITSETSSIIYSKPKIKVNECKSMAIYFLSASTLIGAFPNSECETNSYPVCINLNDVFVL